MSFIKLVSISLILLLLFSCSDIEKLKPSDEKYYSDGGPPYDYTDKQIIADAIPKVEPKSRMGNPQSYDIFGKQYYVLDDSKGYVERGIASWYGKKFHGRKTSNGEIYDMYAMTAAHKTLPIPTYVEVENLKTGKTIIVRINDRGPFHQGRIIDLSYVAAQKLGTAINGTGAVEVRAIDPATWGLNGEKNTKPVQPYLQHQDIQIYLQLGAFKVRKNAEALALDPSLKVIANAFIMGGYDSNLLPIYRVRIGPISTVDIMDDIAERLINNGFDDFYVIIE